jgi:hypothetical protein
MFFYKHFLKNKNLDFIPNEIVCDFEEVIHIRGKLTWPHINVTGCRFHITQAWFRNIQNLGLVDDCRDVNSEIGK